MKFHHSIYHLDGYLERIRSAWYSVAIQIGLETGIFIGVYTDNDGNTGYINRIYFDMNNIQADSETELRRLIKLKAFT